MILPWHWFFVFVCLTPAMASALDAINLRHVIEQTLNHNAPLLVQLQQSEAQQQLVQVEKFAWHPKWLVSLHGDIEKNEDSYHHSSQTKKIGVTPRLSWRTPLGTELQVQATQYGIQGDVSTQQHTRWQISLEQPLLKGANYKINQQGLTQAYRQQRINRYQTKQQKARAIYQVIHDYVNLLNSHQHYTVHQTYLKHQLEHQSYIEEKIKMGRLPEVDGLMHAIQTQKIRQSISQAKLQMNLLHNKLAQTMGVSLAETVKLNPIQWQHQSVNSLQFYQNAANQYLRAPVEWDIQSLQEQAQAIRHQSLWDLRLKGYVTRGKQQYQYEQGQLEYDTREQFYADKQRFIGLSLTVPLHIDYQQKYQSSINKSNLYRAQTELETLLIEGENRVNYLYAQIQHWAEQSRIIKQSYALSEKTKDIMWEKYVSGFASYQEWQQAQSTAMQAALDWQNSMDQYFLANIELDFYVGILQDTWLEYV